MTTHIQTDRRARGKLEAAPVDVSVLQPALASIPSAIAYLGGPSRSKFYADILPRLDVIKLGTRTFVTIDSLDKLIATARKPAAETSP